MSTTTFTSSSPQAVKLWARKAYTDAVKPTLYAKLVGKSDNSIIQIKDDLKNSEGDRIRFRLRALGDGTGGAEEDQTLEGKEDGLEYTNFDIYLGERRKAFKVDLNISEQRTMVDVRADVSAAMDEWIPEYIDTTVMEYMSGAGYGPINSALAPLGTYTSRYHILNGTLGGNALLAPSSDRIIYGGVGNTSAATVVASDKMTLAVLDKVAERAKRASPTFRKASFDGKKLWVVILSPEQVTSIRQNTSTLQWGDIVKAGMMGGGVNSFEGEVLGVYREMLLIESTRIYRYLGGAGNNVEIHRALFLGAQAGAVAHGGKTDGWGKMKLADKEFDFGKRYAQAATFIWGIAKTRFQNQSDFGVYAIDTAATPAV